MAHRRRVTERRQGVALHLATANKQSIRDNKGASPPTFLHWFQVRETSYLFLLLLPQDSKLSIAVFSQFACFPENGDRVHGVSARAQGGGGQGAEAPDLYAHPVHRLRQAAHEGGVADVPGVRSAPYGGRCKRGRVTPHQQVSFKKCALAPTDSKVLARPLSNRCIYLGRGGPAKFLPASSRRNKFDKKSVGNRVASALFCSIAGTSWTTLSLSDKPARRFDNSHQRAPRSRK